MSMGSSVVSSCSNGTWRDSRRMGVACNFDSAGRMGRMVWIGRVVLVSPDNADSTGNLYHFRAPPVILALPVIRVLPVYRAHLDPPDLRGPTGPSCPADPELFRPRSRCLQTNHHRSVVSRDV